MAALINCHSLQVDPNTGVSMYESDEIIKYLVQKYGKIFSACLLFSCCKVNRSSFTDGHCFLQYAMQFSILDV